VTCYKSLDLTTAWKMWRK